MSRCIPVILSGGSGTRLWPLSRSLYPKQLLPLIGNRSLLAETAGRAAALDLAPPIVIANAEHRFIIAEQLRDAGIRPQAIVLEPVARNTAAAVAAAAALAAPEDQILVLAADHYIPDLDAFGAAVATARAAAADGHLVTFGIAPDRAETGYGYIRRGAPLTQPAGAFHLERFVEKPDLATAQAYLADGGWLWNSGMFLFPVGALIAEFERLAPDIYRAAASAVASAAGDLDFLRLDAAAFGAAPATSIDYAVMEGTDRAAVVESRFAWSDIGAWSALWDLAEKDADGTVALGDVMAHDTHNAYLRSEGPLIAAVGLTDTVVVATKDAVLVADRDRAQDVKAILDRLRADGRVEAETHPIRYRPWGSIEVVAHSPGVLVNRIIMKPGMAMRLQRHRRRAEHWVVVDGKARVTRGEDLVTLTADMSTFIPPGTAHRLANPGPGPLLVIEVQTGATLGDSDIERIEEADAPPIDLGPSPTTGV